MKRFLLIVLCAVMMVSLAACAARNTEEPAEESVGGWTINADNKCVLSDEDKDIFVLGTAAQDILYEPVAKIATQVVAGTNHAFLCTSTTDDVTGWYILTVYEPLDGDPELIGIAELDAMAIESVGEADGAEATGAWAVVESCDSALPDNAQAAFDKALEGYTGVGYSPVALLATQLVSGTNYRVLSIGTTVTAKPVTSLYSLDIYEDLDGNAEVTAADVIDLDKYVGANL